MLVLDTGLRTRFAEGVAVEHPALERLRRRPRRSWRRREEVGAWDDEDEPDDDQRGQLDHQGGHGTFISGIVRQVCPDARIHARGVLSSFGDGDDVSVIAAIERAARAAEQDRQPIDVVVMSFGAFSADDAPPPMAYTIGRLLSDSVVVASAGNNSSCRPFFPAALPNVVGVGGLDSAGRAAFSNFGPWVDACAPAVDVVSTFFMEFNDDVDPANDLTAEYHGWASWSGTSFAAPKVAGVIAREMCLRGDSAQATWKRLSDHRRFRYPDLGVVFNV